MEGARSIQNWLANLDPSAASELPLGLLSAQVARLHGELASVLSSSAPPAQHAPNLASAAAALCRAYVAAVDAAALFSANEEADDIATQDLKHLLAPFYLGEVLAGSPAPGGPRHRAVLVAEALHAYNAFLQRCHQYGLLDGPAKRLYEQDEQALGLAGGKVDPTTKRAAKIERFKADKALKAQITMLQQQRDRAAKDQDSQEAGPTGGAAGWDEEDERQLWLATLQQAAITGLAAREMGREEAVLLQHAAREQAQREEAGQRGGGGQDEEARRAADALQKEQVMSELRKVALTLGTTTVKRQQLASEVFRPSYILPTRTLEEQARIEMEDARQREEAERSMREAEARRKEELGGEEDEDELLRQRAWDDWKDSNPRGWGNSKLRPCG